MRTQATTTVQLHRRAPLRRVLALALLLLCGWLL
jgi:hypothetical protein